MAGCFLDVHRAYKGASRSSDDVEHEPEKPADDGATEQDQSGWHGWKF